MLHSDFRAGSRGGHQYVAGSRWRGQALGFRGSKDPSMAAAAGQFVFQTRSAAPVPFQAWAGGCACGSLVVRWPAHGWRLAWRCQCKHLTPAIVVQWSLQGCRWCIFALDGGIYGLVLRATAGIVGAVDVAQSLRPPWYSYCTRDLPASTSKLCLSPAEIQSLQVIRTAHLSM